MTLQERQQKEIEALNKEIQEAEATVKECYSNIKKVEREHSVKV